MTVVAFALKQPWVLQVLNPLRHKVAAFTQQAKRAKEQDEMLDLELTYDLNMRKIGYEPYGMYYYA